MVVGSYGKQVVSSVKELPGMTLCRRRFGRRYLLSWATAEHTIFTTGWSLPPPQKKSYTEEPPSYVYRAASIVRLSPDHDDRGVYGKFESPERRSQETTTPSRRRGVWISCGTGGHRGTVVPASAEVRGARSCSGPARRRRIDVEAGPGGGPNEG